MAQEDKSDNSWSYTIVVFTQTVNAHEAIIPNRKAITQSKKISFLLGGRHRRAVVSTGPASTSVCQGNTTCVSDSEGAVVHGFDSLRNDSLLPSQRFCLEN